jgi:hypothetical protein
VDALKTAGFVVEEVRDLAPESEVPWYGASRHNPMGSSHARRCIAWWPLSGDARCPKHVA